MEHTPTPWHVGTGGGHASKIIYDAAGDAVADAKTYHGLGAAGEAEANAAFIVQAVNAHAALVAALETMESFFGLSDKPGKVEKAEVRAALKLARGEE